MMLSDRNWHRGSPRHTSLGHHFQGQKVKGQCHQAALLSAAIMRTAAAAVNVGTYWAWESTATLRCARRRLTYPTTVLNERMWHLRGQNIHNFLGSRLPTSRIYTTEPRRNISGSSRNKLISDNVVLGTYQHWKPLGKCWWGALSGDEAGFNVSNRTLMLWLGFRSQWLSHEDPGDPGVNLPSKHFYILLLVFNSVICCTLVVKQQAAYLA